MNHILALTASLGSTAGLAATGIGLFPAALIVGGLLAGAKWLCH